ncbi:glycosyltransferase [Listeria innocua]|uniref:glycosyltransferase n=1 Tax=Listeria innocua TaxID=1642 RepID=UPI001628BF91|nr:glycosyltransferase [Listeria innocua]MBC2149907.1 glycosyltransferase [Listeria innocua]
MTVYHINKAIGWASSGVEYAQKYRSLALHSTGTEQRFIFTDYLGTNLIHFTTLLGLETNEIIGIYAFLAQQQNHPSSYPIESFEKRLNSSFSKKEMLQNQLIYTIPNANISYRVWLIDQQFVDRIDILYNQKLIRVEHYSDRLTNIEYFGNNQLISRAFYTEQGSVAYRQFYENRQITLTFIDNKILIGRNAFFQLFFQRLKWNSEDIVLLDRSHELVDAVFPQLNGARVGIIIHAEHYNASYSSPSRILWNNFYEYVFTHDEYVTWYIPATIQQAKTMKEHFIKMNKDTSKIHTIPVGCVDKVNGTMDIRNKYNLVTVSRLATEKHIDLLVKAVVAAKKQFPEVTLSIYGEGGCSTSLQQLISKLNAENYIFLKGHQEMTHEYKKYGGYITASYSEGFGLTLLEAISYGIPIVGFHVPYGNTEFVQEGINGFLVKKTDSEEKNIFNLTAGLVKMLYPHFDLTQAIAYNQEKAAKYTVENIGKRWDQLFSDITTKEGLHEYISS